MIEAEIKVELFEKAIEMLNAITTECRLHVNPEGIYARVIDTANVAIVSVRIPSESFVKYNVIENDEIGVDISKVMNYVRWMRDEEISENVEIIRRGTKDLIIGIDGHKFTMETFDLATVRKDPNQPKIELPVRMEVSANKFINAVKAASIVSDRISFIVDKWEFVIKAVGEKESYQTNIHPKQISAPPGIVQSDFSMDYMKDLIKPMEGETMIRIDMGEEHPVRLLLPIEGLSTTYFLLAPRMRKEEKKGQAGGP